MDRAYATLTVKAVNEDQRIITGIATTPTPDRVGDIVEPLGVKFKNPLPLLHQHNSAEPVGFVRFDKPTAEGITFRAELPQLDEPPSLKDRIDTAWAEIKAGLVRGVSIGFRSLEHSFMDDGGIRFIETEVLELSLVTIPANQDATIQTIKSIDGELLAAMGQGQITANQLRGKVGLSQLPTRPGAAGNPKPIVRLGAKAMPKPISEQITDFTNVRAEKAARMLAIMEASGEKGETLDEAHQQEYDGIETELKSIDEHLARLRSAEKIAAASAKPVTGNTPDDGTASRGAGGPIVTSMRRAAPPGINFARYAMCVAKARGNPDIALKIAENQYPSEQDIHSVLKAAVVAGSTGDPTWGGNLVQYVDLVSDFITFLNPRTVIGAFGQNGVPGFTPAPFNSRIKRQTSGGEGYWVGEGQAKPLTRFDFDFVTMRWTKIANIAALTDEEMRFGSPSAEGLVREALVRAISKRLDLTFMDRTNGGVTDVRPAAITNGITPITSTGTDEAAARTDFGAAMSALGDAELNYGEAVWIMNSGNAIQLFLMQNALGQPSFAGMTGAAGGTLLGRPVVVSNNMVSTGSPATSDIVLVVPSEVYLADDGQVTVDASREASLEMDDAPTMASTSGSPATPTGAQLVSMFQTNSVALRAERYINWMRRRDAAVQVISGAGYSAAA